METERIDRVLKRVVAGIAGEERPAVGLDVETLWSRMVDDRLRAHTYVNRVDRGCAFIRADSAIYLQQLHLNKTKWEKEFRKITGGRVRRIDLSL